MSPTSHTEPQLAGAHCPKCQATCVYEVPMHLVAQGVRSVEIACHACGHAFATELPEEALSSPAPSAPTLEQPDPSTLELSTLDNTDDLNQPVLMDDEDYPKKRSRFGIIIGLALLGTGVIVGIGIIITPPVDRAPLTANIVNIEPAVPEDLPEKASENDEASPTPKQAAQDEAAQNKEGSPKAEPSGPAKFLVKDSGYTISTTALGQVMNIDIRIANIGGEDGRPQSMTVHLISAEGNILMSWPIAPSRRDITAGGEAQYSTQLIEPPIGVSSVEVEVN